MVYPLGHMWYTEPQKELLAEYKLSGLCLRCGIGNQDAIRNNVQTHFCMSCWSKWWNEANASGSDEVIAYRIEYIDEYSG